MGLLEEYPLNWSDRRLRDLRDALATAVYGERDIILLAGAAGLSPADIAQQLPPRLLWTNVMELAGAMLSLPNLVDLAVDRVPALRLKVDELVRTEPVVSAPGPAEPPAWKNFTDNGRERQIVAGQPTLLDIAFLQRGLDRARAVCRLIVGTGRKSFYGTAFRIGKHTLLTNHHVLHDWDNGDQRAVSAHAEFGYEVDLFGLLREPVVVQCDAASIKGEREHDFAVITAAEPIPDDVPILSLTSDAPVRLDDRVYIIQHPQGLPKKIGMHHNLVRYADDRIVQYWTDTEPGSSGSPVFNEAWQVVALHHMAVDAPVGDRIAYRNQGRAIGLVATRLAALGVLPEGGA